ncbi:MAG: hypothetical protein ABIS86_18550 [Streptosporangiaceae bacterium]
MSGRWWGWAGVLVVVLGLQADPGRELLRATGLDGPSRAFSELAFAAPHSLPELVLATTVLELPTFTIGNRTGHTRDYGWTVTLTLPAVPGQAAAPVATGRAVVRDGRLVTVAPSAALQCSPGPIVLTVTLQGSGETIGHRARCTSDPDEVSGR